MRTKINLLVETIEVLKKYNLTLQDIEYVSVNDEYCLPGDYISFADKCEYDNSYGCLYINLNLRIIGQNWWLERQEYDGSEWWVYKTFPTKPTFYNKNLKFLDQ